MRKLKPSVKNSFLESVLRAFGLDRSTTLRALSQAETKSFVSGNYASHGLAKTALQKAELAKSIAIMEFRRRALLR